MAEQERKELAWEDRAIIEWAVAYGKQKVELETPITYQERPEVTVETCRVSYYASLYCGFIYFAHSAWKTASESDSEPWSKQFWVDSGLGTLGALRALKTALEPHGQQRLL